MITRVLFAIVNNFESNHTFVWYIADGRSVVRLKINMHGSFQVCSGPNVSHKITLTHSVDTHIVCNLESLSWLAEHSVEINMNI